MLILNVVYICLATHGRTQRSRAHAIKGRLMLSWVTSCVCTTPREVTQSDCTSSPITCWADYALAPDATYGTAQWAAWSDIWVSFLIIFFKSFIPDAPDFGYA
jgi:hypothetical protein